MNNFYYNLISEKRNTWRNAYEIKIAELEHEKRRYQLTDEEFLPAQAGGNSRPGWVFILTTPLRLLAGLLG